MSVIRCPVFFFLFNTGPPPPLPPLQPSGMDAPPSSITSSVPTIVTSGIRSSLPQASVPMFNSGWCLPYTLIVLLKSHY